MTPNDYTLLEAQTREAIDRKLTHSGWAIQDKNRINLYESLGVAVREMDTDIWPLECVMFMRDVKILAYYVQMKGHGTRIISRDELYKGFEISRFAA